MADVTADIMQSQLNITGESPSNTEMEYIIDTSIDVLNIFHADIPNMTGSTGSKTVSLESAQAGAVKIVTRIIYYGFWKGITTTQGPGGLGSITIPDIMSNPTIWGAIKEIARELREVESEVG